MKLLLITAFLLILAPVAAFSQCPAEMVCISQQAANIAASNARELLATKEKVLVLENALKQKDASISEVQETARKNEADLKEKLNKTTVELAEKTGQLIKSESMEVRLTSIIDFMLKNGRIKKYGIINF